MSKKDDVLDQIERIVKPFDEIGAECMKEAVRLCDKHRPMLRDDFRNVISEYVRRPYYTSSFTTIPYGKESIGMWGCKLWDRKYPLSHLLEDGHAIYNQYGGPYPNRRGKAAGTMKTVAYEEWSPETEEMSNEFYSAVNTIVDNAIKKG